MNDGSLILESELAPFILAKAGELLREDLCADYGVNFALETINEKNCEEIESISGRKRKPNKDQSVFATPSPPCPKRRRRSLAINRKSIPKVVCHGISQKDLQVPIPISVSSIIIQRDSLISDSTIKSLPQISSVHVQSGNQVSSLEAASISTSTSIQDPTAASLSDSPTVSMNYYTTVNGPLSAKSALSMSSKCSLPPVICSHSTLTSGEKKAGIQNISFVPFLQPAETASYPAMKELPESQFLVQEVDFLSVTSCEHAIPCDSHLSDHITGAVCFVKTCSSEVLPFKSVAPIKSETDVFPSVINVTPSPKPCVFYPSNVNDPASEKQEHILLPNNAASSSTLPGASHVHTAQSTVTTTKSDFSSQELSLFMSSPLLRMIDNYANSMQSSEKKKGLDTGFLNDSFTFSMMEEAAVTIEKVWN